MVAGFVSLSQEGQSGVVWSGSYILGPKTITTQDIIKEASFIA